MTAVVVVATIRPRPEYRAEVIAVAELNRALAGRTEGDPDVQILQPNPAGTPGQGAL